MLDSQRVYFWRMNILITGATGMVGEGVMLTCLQDSSISKVVSISRKPSGHVHPKLKEIIVPDLSNLEAHADLLRTMDACFFCAGVSSIGETEETFFEKTYNFVLPFATKLAAINPNLTFTYVSGSGTDSSEKGKVMWARVKGKTENDLLKLPFKAVFNFRPAMMKPVKGQKNIKPSYRYFLWLYPILSVLMPAWTCGLDVVARAMVHCAREGFGTNPLEVKDIKQAGKG